MTTRPGIFRMRVISMDVWVSGTSQVKGCSEGRVRGVKGLGGGGLAGQ